MSSEISKYLESTEPKLHSSLMADTRRNLILFTLPCFIALLFRPTYSQTATITQGQQLKHDQQLVSTSGMFKLGFKSVYKDSSYLGTWYNGEDDNLLWVANRNTPIFGGTGVLEIDDRGSLKIGQPGYPVVLYLYTVEEPCNTSATLEDSGNFVLYELNRDGSVNRVLWESFDYPTDTLLPGMKLGINSKTGLNWSLTSWRSDKSPATGSFSLGLDPNDSSQWVIWWRGDAYWKSGSFRHGFLDDFLSYSSFDLVYVTNENETYFNYSVKKAVTIFPRLKLNSEGELVSYMADSVASQVSCTKNMSRGCSKQNIPACSRSLGSNVFQQHVGFMSNTGFKFSETDNLSLIDCQAKCLNDCSCVAYASKNDDGTGCEIWSTGVSFTESSTRDDRPDNVKRDIFILKPRENKWWTWLIAVLGGLVILPPVCAICYTIWKNGERRGVRMTNQRVLLNEIRGDATASNKNDNLIGHKGDGHDNWLDVFSFESIAAATNCFAVGNKLGAGGFGPVYKGKLVDGREIAISLSLIPKGNTYELEANTKRIVGTFGYMAPEYAFHGIVSVKTDVFSFGVLLLEIVSGKKNNCCYHPEGPLNLIGYAWQLWNEGRGTAVIDPIPDRSCNQNEALRCIHVDGEGAARAETKWNNCSINHVSVSEMEARLLQLYGLNVLFW
ncbi:hypothetical protein V6N13_023886 [Hibiscus sabdariffa]